MILTMTMRTPLTDENRAAYLRFSRDLTEALERREDLRADENLNIVFDGLRGEVG